MSASIIPFMAMTPRRRMISGWLEISWGRRTMRCWNSLRLAMTFVRASGLSEKAVAEAYCILPERSRSIMPSWMTSV
ncbi:hypothetical protein D3C86_1662710 [compost metagenome]